MGLMGYDSPDMAGRRGISNPPTMDAIAAFQVAAAAWHVARDRMDRLNARLARTAPGSDGERMVALKAERASDAFWTADNRLVRAIHGLWGEPIPDRKDDMDWQPRAVKADGVLYQSVPDQDDGHPVLIVTDLTDRVLNLDATFPPLPSSPRSK